MADDNAPCSARLRPDTCMSKFAAEGLAPERPGKRHAGCHDDQIVDAMKFDITVLEDADLQKAGDVHGQKKWLVDYGAIRRRYNQTIVMDVGQRNNITGQHSQPEARFPISNNFEITVHAVSLQSRNQTLVRQKTCCKHDHVGNPSTALRWLQITCDLILQEIATSD